MFENVPELHIDHEDNPDTSNMVEQQSVEWNEIELTEFKAPPIERRKSSVVVSEIEDELNFSQLNSDELEDYFDLIDINEQLPSIRPEVKVKNKKSLHNLISLILPCKIPQLKSSLLLERSRLFAVALTEFNEIEHMHFRLLITIYEILVQKKGHFNEKINQLKNSTKIQNYVFALSPSSNNLEAPTSRARSIRRFKNVHKSFKARNSLGNQSIKCASSSLQNNMNRRESGSSSIKQHDERPKNDAQHLTNSLADYEVRERKSFDLSALKKTNVLNDISTSHVNSQYKYRLNDEDVSDQKILESKDQSAKLSVESSNQTKSGNINNSLDSLKTSLNSNFEYLSCIGKSTDINSNYLNGSLNQYSSTGHLSINNLSINNRSCHLKRNSFSKRSSYSSNHSWVADSRKSSNASVYSRLSSYSSFNERISVTIFHRTIRYGDHWQEIGFQGNDPVTDLRDLGILSLFNMCYFLLNHERLALEIYKLSLDEEQNFPFALTAINISQICLQTLRQGHLNRILNSKNDVFEPFNLFYSSLFLRSYQLWSEGKKTILNSNEVLTELRTVAATKPKQLIEKLNVYHSEMILNEHQANDNVDKKDQNNQVLEFTDISKVVAN